MVLQRRLDYGFNGYQMLFIPRAARSARRRSSPAKKVENNKMCAFDLLATVAGKLLLETDSPPISSNTSTEKDQCMIVEKAVKKEVLDEGKPLKIEPYDQGSSDMKCFASEVVSQACDQNYDSKESQHSQNDAHSGLTSVITNSNCSAALGAESLESDRSTNETIGSKEEASLLGFRGTGDCKVETEVKMQIKDELHNTGMVPIGARADMCSLENPVAWDGKPSVQVCLDSSSAKVPLCKDHILSGSYTLSRDDVKIVSIDDDENSSGCTHPSTSKGRARPSPIRRFYRPSSRIGDRRIRKLLASRYWKVAPKLKDGELQNTDGESKSVYRSRKNCYKRQRSQRNYPSKKRKIFYRSSLSNSSCGAGNDAVSHPLAKVINRDASGSALKMHAGIAATGTTSSVASQLSSFQSRDSRLKLRIQSIRVPELFIEIPETATVGSLKKTVMEAVTAILGGGLHVGVLLQGKKVRDDHKTLQQTGISRDNHLEALGFTLEPTLSQVSPRLCPEDPSFRLPSGIPQPLTRYPPESAVVHQETTDTSPELHVANLDNFVESNHDSAPSSDESLIDKNTADSKALVAVPAMSVEALAMVPAHHKSKRSELAQRRIRRPFSVTEVEALVHAVEKLGTGRWRDVKLRAFDNANHRTYVDLKDKWKTLVHTARISPQQRRGEPVPQELLDRVLAAHAYWSKQQAKQQQQETCLLL